MTATERLRKLLDERGVEWGNVQHDGSESDYFTEWCPGDPQDYASAYEWSVGDGLNVRIIRTHLTPEQAIAATLGDNGVARSNDGVTAEQVRKAIFNGSSYASYDGAKYYADGISMQAIADELNATLGAGTCHTVEDGGLLHCSECGGGAEKQSWAYWNFCPNCGRKVER